MSSPQDLVLTINNVDFIMIYSEKDSNSVKNVYYPVDIQKNLGWKPDKSYSLFFLRHPLGTTIALETGNPKINCVLSEYLGLETVNFNKYKLNEKLKYLAYSTCKVQRRMKFWKFFFRYEWCNETRFDPNFLTFGDVTFYYDSNKHYIRPINISINKEKYKNLFSSTEKTDK
jgi:hypothetical protein